MYFKNIHLNLRLH